MADYSRFEMVNNERSIFSEARKLRPQLSIEDSQEIVQGSFEAVDLPLAGQAGAPQDHAKNMVQMSMGDQKRLGARTNLTRPERRMSMSKVKVVKSGKLDVGIWERIFADFLQSTEP